MSVLSIFPLAIGISITLIALYKFWSLRYFPITLPKHFIRSNRIITYFALFVAAYNFITASFYENSSTSFALIVSKIQYSLLCVIVLTGVIYVTRLLQDRFSLFIKILILLLILIIPSIIFTDFLFTNKFTIKRMIIFNTPFIEALPRTSGIIVISFFITMNVFYIIYKLLVNYKNLTISSKVFFVFSVLFCFAYIHDILMITNNINFIYLKEYIFSLMAILLFVTMSEFLGLMHREINRANKVLQEEKKRIEELDDMRHTLICNINHELNTPLNTVIGFSDLIMEMSDNPEKVLSYANDIKKSGQELFNKVSQIIYFSKINSDEVAELEIIEINNSDIIEFVEHQFNLLNHKKDLTLSINIDNVDGSIHTDWNKLQNILIQLISNAVKFSKRGTIEFKLINNDNGYHFSIKDPGIGLKPEQQENIFDDFVQVQGSYSKVYYGLGLGLAITKRLLDLLNAKIYIESEVGKGSTFSFILSKSIDKI